MVVGLRTKNRKLRELAFSSGFTALMGITEPALYGVTLKLKRPLIATCIGGGVAGLYAGITHLHTYSSTTAGLLALPVYIGGDGFGNVINAVITIIISIVVTAIATFILGFDDPADEDAATVPAAPSASSQENKVVLSSPIYGQAVPLESVKDDAFASHTLGLGAAVRPEEGVVTAPASATVTSVADSGHAIGLTTDSGVELLIHIGLDTVERKGRGFAVRVKTGDHVQKDQELIRFDLEDLRKAGYDVTSPVIVTNSDDFLDVVAVRDGKVGHSDTLLTVLRRS